MGECALFEEAAQQKIPLQGICILREGGGRDLGLAHGGGIGLGEVFRNFALDVVAALDWDTFCPS